MFKQYILDKLAQAGAEIEAEVLEIPPDPQMGDFALPCFVLSKEWKKSPAQIATELADKIETDDVLSKVVAQGPYLNFFVRKEALARSVLSAIHKEKKDYGRGEKKDETVLVESPGPNTNKPLHLGHVRNMVLGNALMNILTFSGYDAKRVDIINDRGVHICKSMLAYRKFGDGKEPDKKPDHFVGDFYVRYALEKEKHPEMEEEIQQMLVDWEKGDPETMQLWKKMRDWAIEGMKETYERYGVDMDKAYNESDHYTKGKDKVMEGLKEGIFRKDDKGNIYYTDDDIEKKIVLRADGTSIYITQDIALGKLRYDDFHMDRMVYVVGSEQIHHFRVLFKIFDKLRYPFADGCYHLAYGMVYLPEGKMKSREGKVVDADNLADDMHDVARKEIAARYDDIGKEELDRRAEMIGMAAIKFFILKYDPLKDFIFDQKESLSFDGETGPYVQYTHARSCSVLEKFGSKLTEDVDFSRLDTPEDKQVLTLLNQFPAVVADAAENYKPSLVTRHLLDLSQAFNEYYHKHKVLQEDRELEKARILLVGAVRQVLSVGLGLLGIEAPEVM